MKPFLRNTILIVVLMALSIPVPARARGMDGSGQANVNEPTAPNVITVNNPTELIAAISSVVDGGVIEMNGGTYAAPLNGFVISNQLKRFTVRAATGAVVKLSGNGMTTILRLENNDLTTGGPVTFQGLTFEGGAAQNNGWSGGVHITKAEATFVSCTFSGNFAMSSGSGSGGAMTIYDGSKVFIVDSTFSGNGSRGFGGAIYATDDSQIFIHHSVFTNNRTNYPGHTLMAGGGAIAVLDGKLRITNTRFDSNQAGYVGGAVYALGNWTTAGSDVIISNSTFINNQAKKDPSVGYIGPTEAGAVHAERKTSMKIYSSRFITNKADIGGGVNGYQAPIIAIYGSVFLGNQAVDTITTSGFGGAIAAKSDGGAINLTVEDSYFQGRYGTIPKFPNAGGAIWASTATGPRGAVTLRRVVVNDCDTSSSNGGPGGALYFGVVNVTLDNVLVGNSDAVGPNGMGGGLLLVANTVGNITSSTFAHNSAGNGSSPSGWGGAIYSSGSVLNLNSSNLFENQVWGTTQFDSRGAAIFTNPGASNALGMVQGNTFSHNAGMTIYDQDSSGSPYNGTQYNNNHFFSNTFGTKADDYYDNMSAPVDAPGLNSLTIIRSGSTTDKSPGNNNRDDPQPVLGTILPVPPYTLPVGAYGDSGAMPAYLGYAWTGGAASLDGAAVSGYAGGSPTTIAGTHTLLVSAGSAPLTVTTTVSQGANPAATLTDRPNGAAHTLIWSLQAGTYLDMAIDDGANVTAPAASGQMDVTAAAGAPFRLFMVTKEGGVVVLGKSDPTLSAPDTINLLVGLNQPVRRGQIPMVNLGGGSFNWTATLTGTDIKLTATGGTVATTGYVPFDILPNKAGPYTASVFVNAGAAGSKTVRIDITIVDFVYQDFMPLISH